MIYRQYNLIRRGLPTLTCMARTKGEARSNFKDVLRVSRLRAKVRVVISDEDSHELAPGAVYRRREKQQGRPARLPILHIPRGRRWSRRRKQKPVAPKRMWWSWFRPALAG